MTLAGVKLGRRCTDCSINSMCFSKTFIFIYFTIFWFCLGLISAYLMIKLGHRTTVMIGGLIACLASVASVIAPSVAILDITAGLITGARTYHKFRNKYFSISPCFQSKHFACMPNVRPKDTKMERKCLISNCKHGSGKNMSREEVTDISRLFEQF